MADASAAASGGPAPVSGLRIDVKVPQDSDVTDRNRFVRWAALIVFSVITIGAPLYFGVLWTSTLLNSPNLGVLIGLAVAAVLIKKLLERSLISNPEWTGYVSLNPLTGDNVPYGPGLHPALPWEQRNVSGNYPLKVVTKTFEIPIQTTTSQIIAVGMFQYQVDLAHIVNNVGIDETTVNEGYNGFIENFLTSKLARSSAEDARAGIDETNASLADQFMGSQSQQGSVPEFETKNGLRTVAVAITGLKMPPAVQKTRDAVDEAKKIFQIMAEFKGVTTDELRTMIADGRVDKEEEAGLRRAALATSENAEMKIVDGSLGGAAGLGEAMGINDRGKKKK